MSVPSYKAVSNHVEHMAKILDPSREIALETAQGERYIEQIYPITAIQSSTSHLDFILRKGGHDDHMHLDDVENEIEVQVKDAAGKILEDTDLVGISQCLANTLYCEVKTKIHNQEPCSASASNTHWKSIIEGYTSSCQGARDTHLLCQGWVTEPVGLFQHTEETVTGTGDNQVTTQISSGWNARKIIAHNGVIKLRGKVQSDFFKGGLRLAPGDEMMVRFKKTPDDILLQIASTCTKKYKLHILKHVMHVPHIRTRRGIVPTAGDRQYIFNRTEIKYFNLPSTKQTAVFPLQSDGVLPKSVIFCQVTSESFNGDLKNNSYHFPNFNLEKVQLRLNSQLLPVNGVNIEYDANDKPNMIEAYQHFCRNTGHDRLDMATPISYAEYANDLHFHAWDLSPDRCNQAHLHVSDTGSADILVTYKKPLDKSIYLMALVTYKTVVKYDKSENKMLEVTI